MLENMEAIMDAVVRERKMIEIDRERKKYYVNSRCPHVNPLIMHVCLFEWTDCIEQNFLHLEWSCLALDYWHVSFHNEISISTSESDDTFTLANRTLSETWNYLLTWNVPKLKLKFCFFFCHSYFLAFCNLYNAHDKLN